MRSPGIQEPGEVLHKVLAMKEKAHPRENYDLQGRQVEIGVVTGAGAADGANDIGFWWIRER